MTFALLHTPFEPILGLNAQGLTGKLYYGQVNLDPVTYPKAVWWDAAGTQAASQPIDVQGGYPMRDGTPAQLFMTLADHYSVLATTMSGVHVWLASNMVAVDGASAATTVTESFVVTCSDETTAIAVGTAKRTWRSPYAFVITAVRASLKTAQASGTIFTVDIKVGGTSILSTKLTIDNTEKSSTTAAIPAVISLPTVADDAEYTFDVTQIGDGTAVGLNVVLIGHQP